MRRHLQVVRHLGCKQAAGVLLPQPHPGGKVGGRDALQHHVFAKHVALEAARAKRHGAPEVHQPLQVGVPLAVQGLLKHGPQQWVLAHIAVKTMHQPRDAVHAGWRVAPWAVG